MYLQQKMHTTAGFHAFPVHEIQITDDFTYGVEHPQVTQVGQVRSQK